MRMISGRVTAAATAVLLAANALTPAAAAAGRVQPYYVVALEGPRGAPSTSSVEQAAARAGEYWVSHCAAR